MYAIFGLIVWRLGAMKAMVFAGLAASAIAMLAAELNSGWEDLLRGVAGFFSGCCVALAKTPLRARLHPAWVWGGLALIVVFMAFKPEGITWDPAIYPLAGLTIWALLRAAPGGAIDLLRSTWLAYLGKISYSVYMCHAAVIWAITTVLRRATRLPQAGGQYVYLREAYHPAVAFIYGWVLLLVTQTGGMAAVAVTFARYFREISGAAWSDSSIAAVVLLAPAAQAVAIVGATSLVFLAALGAVAARAGGAPPIVAAVRVTFWGALAMALTAAAGKWFGAAA